MPLPTAADDRPTAFVAMPFSPSLDSLYEDVIRPALGAFDIRAVRADEILKSDTFKNNIYAAIEEASLVIGVTSNANPNVFYELGYALQLRKEVILMTDDASALPSDIRDITHLIYSPADLQRALDALKAWIAETLVGSESTQPSVLRRGEVFESIVDGTFYLQTHRPLPSKEAILECLAQRRPFPQRLMYLTEAGQTAYLQLCSDPEYLYYRETTDLISRLKKDLVDLIDEHASVPEIDFVSLGPGNGQKDALLLDEFTKRARPHKFVYYYPYDVSGGLLLEAIRNVFAKKLPATKLRVKAIEGDLRHLQAFKAVFDFRPAPNVYSLLGGLANIGNEMTLLSLLHQVMTNDDWLLCEVRRKGSPDSNDAMGQIDLNRRLDLAPLAYFGARYDTDAVEYVEVNSRSSIPNTRTIVGRLPEVVIGRQVFRDVDLFPIDYYDRQSLTRKLHETGFRIIQQHGHPHSLFYVLRRA